MNQKITKTSIKKLEAHMGILAKQLAEHQYKGFTTYT